MAQTLTEIRAALEQAGLRPQKMFGQNFLVDHNLLQAVVDLAHITPGDAVVEIGPGTGALTDVLLEAGAKVLAVEIDRGLAELLRDRYAGRDDFKLLNCDVLAGKHEIDPEVLAAANQWANPNVHIVANLPYNIATTLVCELLMLATAADRGQEPALPCSDLTITVQHEVAGRFGASVGDELYGAVSVLCALLGHVTLGKKMPCEAFWPRPKVTSRMLRIDARPPDVDRIPDIKALRTLLALAFGQRRKKIGSLAKRHGAPMDAETWARALAAAGVDGNVRPERIAPDEFAALAGFGKKDGPAGFPDG